MKYPNDENQSEPKVWGVAYYIEEEDRENVFNYLDFREKNGYESTMISVHTVDGIIDCHLYVASTDNEAFLGPQPLAVIALHIKSCIGPSGPNLEYLMNLHQAHKQLTIEKDQHLEDLVELITQGSLVDKN